MASQPTVEMLFERISRRGPGSSQLPAQQVWNTEIMGQIEDTVAFVRHVVLPTGNRQPVLSQAVNPSLWIIRVKVKRMPVEPVSVPLREALQPKPDCDRRAEKEIAKMMTWNSEKEGGFGIHDPRDFAQRTINMLNVFQHTI